jgi:hypothetical protein
MKIVGIVLALLGLWLLVPAILICIQLASGGDVNIDRNYFHRELILTAVGLVCVVSGSTLAIRYFGPLKATAQKP